MKKIHINRFKLGYTEILLDVPLEKALFQNNQREKFKQIPEFIIKNCYNKIERNFTNGIDFKEESDIINVVSQALNILQESVFIKNEYQENKLKDEKNFFHLLDLLFREEIGKINKIYSSEWDDRKKKSNNKLMAEFKKVYIDLIKFILFHQNHPDYDKSKEEKKKSFELISKNSQLNFQFTEKIILQIFDENHSKITNDLTKIAEIFSNSFSEFSLFLFKK